MGTQRQQDRTCGEGVSFLTVAQRRRVLLASESMMGDGSAKSQGAKAWRAHRAELEQVQRSRAANLEDTSDWQPMLSTLKQAQARASKLSMMLRKAKKVKLPGAVLQRSASTGNERSVRKACIQHPTPRLSL